MFHYIFREANKIHHLKFYPKDIFINIPILKISSLWHHAKTNKTDQTRNRKDYHKPKDKQNRQNQAITPIGRSNNVQFEGLCYQ